MHEAERVVEERVNLGARGPGSVTGPASNQLVTLGTSRPFSGRPFLQPGQNEMPARPADCLVTQAIHDRTRKGFANCKMLKSGSKTHLVT